MIQGLRISIKKEPSRDTTLIQTNIFDAFKNLTALSKKQQRMKSQKEKQSSSEVFIVISDDSDLENEVAIKPSNDTSEDEGLLPSYFEDDSDDSNEEDGCPSKLQCSLKGNGEMMVLNKPIACSTPLRASPTSFVKRGTMNDNSDSDSTIIMDPTSLEETFSNTISNSNINSVCASTSIEKGPILVQNSLEKRIFIMHDVLLKSKTTSGNFTNTLTNSKIPNNVGTNTCREDIETDGFRNQDIVNIIKSCKSTSTTDDSNNKENPRQIIQMCRSSVNPRIIETDKSEPSLSNICSQKNLNPINQSTLKCSNETQISAKNTNLQKIVSNSQKSSPSELSINCRNRHKKSDTRNQRKLKSLGSDIAKIKPKNSNLHKTVSNKLISTSSKPMMNCSNLQEKSDTEYQKNTSESVSSDNTKTVTNITTSQKIHSSKVTVTTSSNEANPKIHNLQNQNGVSNNNNILSSTNVPQTPTKCNPNKPCGSATPGKETRGSEQNGIDPPKIHSKEVNSPTLSNMPRTPAKCNPNKPCGSATPGKETRGSEQNGIDPPEIHRKEVNSPTLSNIPRTPTKHKLSDSPTTSPSKRANKTPSPKKEERRMNINYLTVFKKLFLSVRESPHLRNLIEKETPVLKLIISSDPKYFYFILKLLTWLPKRYNIFRFCEKILLDMEEKDVLKMYKFLQENGIVDVDFSKEDIGTLLNDLDRVAVKRICEKFKLKRSLSGKKNMINALLQFCRTQCTLTFTKSAKELILDEVLRKMGKCVKLKDHIQEAFYRTFLLGTFTNPSLTNMQEFFKSMLYTKTVFPEYRIENYCVFYTREEFKRYAKARRFKDCLDEAFKIRNHIEVFQISETVYTALRNIGNENTQDRFKNVPHFERFTARYVYISILSEACEYLKTKYPRDAKKWLEYLLRTFPLSHRLGNWYYQLTWLYMRYLDPIDYMHAAELLIEILQNKRECLSDVQLHMLGERGEQLKRGTNYNKIDQLCHDIIADLVPEPIKLEHFPEITIDARAIRSNEIGKKRKYLSHVPGGDKHYLSVENIALDYYTNRCGYTGGIHCEGSLIKASFTLFFWDLIYSPEILVPGTFLSNYQEVPLDMTTAYFYTNRKDAIDKRLRDISSEWSDSKTIEFVKNSYDMHSHESGFCEPGVYIKDGEMLETLVNCIGRKVLAKIYERLVKNVGQYSSGMPDLFLWNIEEKKSKFVEVKGENDKLSIKQKLWLKYLESSGAHIEVCIVHSIGSKRKQKVKCVTASTIIEKGGQKEQASSSVSSSACSRTPKNNNSKPKLKSGATPKKKPRSSKEKKEDNRASTSANTVLEDSDSGSD